LFDVDDALTLTELDDLGIVEIRQDYPDRLVLALDQEPFAEVGSQGGEVMFETGGCGKKRF
jgi:hypothetical protein